MTIRKLQVVYRNHLRQNLSTNIYTRKSLEETINKAAEEGKTHIILNGIEIFPMSVKEVRKAK